MYSETPLTAPRILKVLVVNVTWIFISSFEIIVKFVTVLFSLCWGRNYNFGSVFS